MRRIHGVAVLSDARFAPIDPLRHPPQSVIVHSRNDSGDTGGGGQGPVMDRLVAELGGGGGTGCSALRVGPQQLRFQLNDPLFERLAFHSSGGAGATIPGCPAPQASPIPPFPFSSVLLLSSLLPLLLPPKPHFSVATPSFLSSDGSRVISFFASQSLHNKKKLKKNPAM